MNVICSLHLAENQQAICMFEMNPLSGYSEEFSLTSPISNVQAYKKGSLEIPEMPKIASLRSKNR